MFQIESVQFSSVHLRFKLNVHLWWGITTNWTNTYIVSDAIARVDFTWYDLEINYAVIAKICHVCWWVWMMTRPGINVRCFKIQIGNDQNPDDNADFSKFFTRFARNFAQNTKSPGEVCQSQKIQMVERTFSPSLWWQQQSTQHIWSIYYIDEENVWYIKLSCNWTELNCAGLIWNTSILIDR